MTGWSWNHQSEDRQFILIGQYIILLEFFVVPILNIGRLHSIDPIYFSRKMGICNFENFWSKIYFFIRLISTFFYFFFRKSTIF